jgi:dUTP pyrophosphatase
MTDNNQKKIKIKKLYEDTIVPSRAHVTDSGMDLFVYQIDKLFSESNEDGVDIKSSEILLSPGSRILVNTGIAATVGVGYEIQIRPRSGLALKQGLTVLNTPGTIDEAYRGIFGVIIINLSSRHVKIEKGMKIAQMVACPVFLGEVEIVDDLNATDRGTGGFGSTGV